MQKKDRFKEFLLLSMFSGGGSLRDASVDYAFALDSMIPAHRVGLFMLPRKSMDGCRDKWIYR